MSKRWISDRRSRASQEAQDVLSELKMDKAMKALKQSLDRATRHAMASQAFRRTGDVQPPA